MNRVYHIKMLGTFSMECCDEALKSSFGRMQQVWNLLEYLLMHRTEEVSQQALIEVLWPDQKSGNPANALKNLAYRLRTILSEAFPGEKRQFILYHRKSYFFNPDIECVLDVEIFERAFQRSLQAHSVQHKLECLNEALDSYTGELLPHSMKEIWLIPLRSHYHYMYLQAVDCAAQLLFETKKYERAITVLQKAIEFEPYEEKLHSLLMKSLAASNCRQQAIDHYYKTSNLFYNDLGIKVSDSLTSVYNSIVKSMSHEESSLNEIEESLRVMEKAEGAFYCDYEVFKSIYASETRRISRLGHSLFVVLLTVSHNTDQAIKTSELMHAMQLLKQVACSSLRKSDIVTRFSPTQYILLLSYLDNESCNLVIDRILSRFERELRDPAIYVKTSHYSVTPA